MTSGSTFASRARKWRAPRRTSARITISNLKRDVRNYLPTETSPFNPNRTPKRLYVDVGESRPGLQRIFVGEIVQSVPSQPPDIGLTLKALTGAYSRGFIIALEFRPGRKSRCRPSRRASRRGSGRPSTCFQADGQAHRQLRVQRQRAGASQRAGTGRRRRGCVRGRHDACGEEPRRPALPLNASRCCRRRPAWSASPRRPSRASRSHSAGRHGAGRTPRPQ